MMAVSLIIYIPDKENTDSKVRVHLHRLKESKIDWRWKFKSSEQLKNVYNSLNTSQISCIMKTPVFEKEINTASNKEDTSELDEKRFIKIPWK